MTSLASSQVTGPHWIPVIFRRTGWGAGTRGSGLVDFGGVDARRDAVRGLAEASQLLRRQGVDDERPHVGRVPGCRFGERLEALAGQDGTGEPPVRGVRLPAHQASLLE